jgi:tetratricopeptide (TPR) repeat protein
MLSRTGTITLCLLSTTVLLVLGQTLRTTRGIDQPNGSPASDSLLQQAKEAEKSGNFSKAAEHYVDYLRTHPRAASVLQRLGLDYYLGNRFGDAVPAFMQALKLEPDLWGSALFLGISYYRLGQFEMALTPLRESLRLKPDLDEAHFWLGSSFLALGRSEAAITELERIPKGSSLRLQADSLLVQAYRKAAEANYQRIETTDPDSYRLHQLQADLSAWEGNVTKAIVEYREAIKRKPDLEGAHRAIADLYWQGQQFDLAEKEYEQELFWNPLDGPSRVRVGLYWLRRGDGERARQDLEVASRARQDSAKAYQELGQGWLALADFPKAESSLNRAIEGDPLDAFNHQLLAEVYERTGRLEMAQKERKLFQELSAKAGNVLTDAVRQRE